MTVITRARTWGWLLAMTLAMAGSGAGHAQDVDATKAAVRPRSYQNARDLYRERLNENALFMMGGQPGAV